MKIPKASLERTRPLLFLVGLVFALSITLVSFEWRTPYHNPVTEGSRPDVPESPQGYSIILPEPERKVEKPPLPKTDSPSLQLTITDDNDVEEVTDPMMTFEVLDDLNGIDLEPTEGDVDDLQPYDWVPKMPEYCSGAAEMMNVLAKNLNYPQIPLENGISGVVVVQFTVTDRGELQDAKVIRPVDPWLDAEALRVVKLLNCFEPGQQGGRNVDVFLKLPIRFVIE